jgi:hypothetical protein
LTNLRWPLLASDSKIVRVTTKRALGPSGSVWEPLRGFGTLWNLWAWKLLGASGSLWETLRAFGNWKNAGNRNKQQEHNTNNVYLRDLFGPTSIVLAAV